MKLLTKDILRVEKYHPNPADPSFVVDVTPDVLDHWSRTFNDMQAENIGIPLTFEHPPRGDVGADPAEMKEGDPRLRAGWVNSVYRDGDTLMGVFEVPDDYADDLLESGCYVSPKFGGTWTDSLKRKWENPIHHIALTTKPVAVNQTRTFTQAFSRGQLPSAFENELNFSTSSGQFQEWSQPETDMPDALTPALTPAEAVDRLFENPDFVQFAREKLGSMPVQQFSADPGMPGMPPGMPGMQPGQDQPAPEDMGGGEDTSPDIVAVCMGILHQVSQAVAEGMKAMAQLHGMQSDDDQDDVPPAAAPPQAAPQPVATPAAVQMSREGEVIQMSREQIMASPVFAAMENKLSRVERDSLTSRVNALFATGRCLGPKRDALLADVGKYEFSRQTEQPNILLLHTLSILEDLPENAAIPVDGKLEFSRKPTVSKPDVDGGEMTDERADEIVARLIHGN